MDKLESGNSYKLTDLFTDNRYIIIPDLQRDYCWGDKKHGDNKIELVSGFLDSLNDVFIKNSGLKLGMIYAYEYPENSNRIFLCDGQQRITTLFLLLGMINRHIDNEKIKDFLISKTELIDDQEPRLQYAIRESTLYFLSDLVCNFFLTNTETKVSEIKKPLTKWYFDEYNLDPTIQSMILAMEIIENKLSDFGDLQKFGDFLLNKIEFFYFDMKNRETGEDMFVVINTTGEPLTATENIKPILIGNNDNPEERKSESDLWEKWEKWFWINKYTSEYEADNGLNAFFISYWQIKLLQENQWKDNKSYDINPFQLFTHHSEIEVNEESDIAIKLEEINKAKSIAEIEKYFQAYKNLFLDFDSKENQYVLNSIKTLKFAKANCMREIPIKVVLPLIQFKIKYPKESINPFLRRLRKNYFDGHKDWKERKKNYVDWRHLIQLIDKSTSIENLFCFSDDSNFKEISNVPNNIKYWFNPEEQLKTELKKEHKELVEKIEDHHDFMGDLNPLFTVTEYSNDITKLKVYYEWYDKIQKRDIDSIKIKNLYRLNSLLSNGYFDHRGVAGYGYCMLIESTNKSFLLKDFDEIWRKYVNEYSLLEEFFETKIATYFKENNILENLKGAHSHYNRVKVWAILEYLYNENKEIDFSKSISCFWDMKQNLKIQGETEGASKIGNLKLGVSWFNNKSGWVQYELPLMKMINEIKNEDFNIENFTVEYEEKLKLFLN